ncbi:MAG: TRAM domain-containing protein [Candidatus Diapherotrites archaeon]
MSFSKYNTHRFKPEVPVKEGEMYDVEIEGVGEKGDGIARIQGFVVIVPNTKQGDKVKVKVNAVRGKVSFAEVVQN